MKSIKQIIALYKNSEYLPDNGKIIRATTNRLFIVTSVLGVYYALISILKDYNPESNFLVINLPIITVLLGISSSLLVSSGFAYFAALLEVRKENNLAHRKKFRDFFDCQTNEEVDDSIKDDVVIVLPRYKNVKGEEDYDAVKTKIIEKSKEEGDRYYRRSIKSNIVSADNSFSQSDTIAAASMVAAFAKVNMRLPTIRTDLQGISKLFQYDERGKMRDDNVVIKMIKDHFGSENFSDLYPGKEIESIVKGMSIRKYKTYISIGMFSNAFLMDLIINKCNGTENHYFDCKMVVDKDENIKRIIYIYRQLGETPYSTEPLDINDRNPSVDFALIAKTSFMKKNIIVCAGVTEAGTQAAALYLAMKWEKIVDEMRSIKDKNFAIVLKIDRSRFSGKDLSSKKPWDSYPLGLFNKLGEY